MTPAEQIKNWLETNRDYETGVHLYLKFGNSSSLKNILIKSDFTKKRYDDLIYELEKLAKSSGYQKTIKSKKKKKKKNHEIIRQKAIELKQTKNFIGQNQDLELEKNELFKQVSNLHYSLKNIADNNERKTVAFAILNKWDKLTELWAILDGKIINKPEKKDNNEIGLIDLVKRQQTLRTYISKYSKQIQKSTKGETIAKYERKLAEFTIELEDVERKLSIKL